VGYREALNDNIAAEANGFFRYRKDLPDMLELNLKVLMMDRFWLGVSHRLDYATNS
jgi:hypothetical protein